MYIMKYLKPYKWQAISGFIFKLIEAFLELCIPMAVALIIDNGVAVHNTNYITKMAFVIFGLSTVGYAIIVWQKLRRACGVSSIRCGPMPQLPTI